MEKCKWESKKVVWPKEGIHTETKEKKEGRVEEVYIHTNSKGKQRRDEGEVDKSEKEKGENEEECKEATL